MRAITFSSTAPVSYCLILSNNRYHPFVVSERIAAFLCWFLGSVIAQFFVLLVWDFAQYVNSWKQDLFIIFIAIALLFGAKRYLHYRDY